MSRKFLSELWKSITSVQFYQEIAQRPLTEGLRYFSFLILLVTLLLSVRFTGEVLRVMEDFERWTRERLPNIVIEKGKVFADIPQPWQASGEDFVVVIDTTGKTREIGHEYPRGVLIMESKILLKRDPTQSRIYDVSRINAFRFTPETVARWRRVGRWILPPLLAFFLFVYFWTGKLLQVFFFSGISLLINWAMRKGLSYAALLTVGLYAVTPPLLLFLAVALLGMRARFFDMICLSAYAALLVSAILQFPPQGDEAPTES